MDNSNEDFVLEKAFERLNQITQQLEVQGTSLKESLELYSEGVALANKCKENLEGVEKEIKYINGN